MDQKALDNIVEKYCLPFSKDESFLALLKNDPEKIVSWVTSHLNEWSTVACFELGRTIYIPDFQKSALAVVNHCKTVLAKELAAIK